MYEDMQREISHLPSRLSGFGPTLRLATSPELIPEISLQHVSDLARKPCTLPARVWIERSGVTGDNYRLLINGKQGRLMAVRDGGSCARDIVVENAVLVMPMAEIGCTYRRLARLSGSP